MSDWRQNDRITLADVIPWERLRTGGRFVSVAETEKHLFGFLDFSPVYVPIEFFSCRWTFDGNDAQFGMVLNFSKSEWQEFASIWQIAVRHFFFGPKGKKNPPPPNTRFSYSLTPEGDRFNLKLTNVGFCLCHHQSEQKNLQLPSSFLLLLPVQLMDKLAIEIIKRFGKPVDIPQWRFRRKKRDEILRWQNTNGERRK